MPILNNITFCHFATSTARLIDWETGIYDAVAKEAPATGVEIDLTG